MDDDGHPHEVVSGCLCDSYVDQTLNELFPVLMTVTLFLFRVIFLFVSRTLKKTFLPKVNLSVPLLFFSASFVSLLRVPCCRILSPTSTQLHVEKLHVVENLIYVMCKKAARKMHVYMCTKNYMF